MCYINKMASPACWDNSNRGGRQSGQFQNALCFVIIRQCFTLMSFCTTHQCLQVYNLSTYIYSAVAALACCNSWIFNAILVLKPVGPSLQVNGRPLTKEENKAGAPGGGEKKSAAQRSSTSKTSAGTTAKLHTAPLFTLELNAVTNLRF